MVKTYYDGPVNCKKEVRLEATKEQADELRKALEIVNRWEKKALVAFKHKRKNADWTMVDFAVKNDAVVVTLEAGACG